MNLNLNGTPTTFKRTAGLSLVSGFASVVGMGLGFVASMKLVDVLLDKDESTDSNES